MTTVTETAAAAADALPYDALLISQAHEVFTRAKSVGWSEPGREDIGTAVMGLAGALKRYWDLRNGIVPPGSLGIPAGREGFARALRAAAEDAWEAADEVEAIREHCGTGMAALTGGEGEKS